jgi:hypothetical protein
LDWIALGDQLDDAALGIDLGHDLFHLLRIWLVSVST